MEKGHGELTHADVFCSFAVLRQGAFMTEGVGLLPKMKITMGQILYAVIYAMMVRKSTNGEGVYLTYCE